MTVADLLDSHVCLFAPPAAPNTLFLDRDGGLNDAVIRDCEISSPRHIGEFRMVEDIEALADPAIRAAWNLVVLTNQPDLSRGVIDLPFLDEIHGRLRGKIPLSAVYVCPHQGSDHCSCRKPACGLVERFRKEHPRAVNKQLLVGDRSSDKLCAEAAGIPFCLRLRDYNRELASGSGYVLDSLWDLKALLSEGGL